MKCPFGMICSECEWYIESEKDVYTGCAVKVISRNLMESKILLSHIRANTRD